MYTLDGSETKLLASDGDVRDDGLFGFSVAISGETSLIGAVTDSENGLSSGAAYFYRFDGTEWVEEAKFFASDVFANDPSDHFGRSVSISDRVAIVGAPQHNPGGLSNAGASYAFNIGPACNDDRDNDSDGFVDWIGGDPGCDDADDAVEKADSLPCDDGIDNETSLDGLVGFRTDGFGDPGCKSPTYFTEEPQCQDGINNDRESGIDFDGGESVWGAMIDDPDPECLDMPWRDLEAVPEPFVPHAHRTRTGAHGRACCSEAEGAVAPSTGLAALAWRARRGLSA